MSQALTYNIEGKELEKTTLPKEMFGQEASPSLLAQAVRVFLANQRRGMAKTKTRAEIAKTTAKMYKQKGTGRARHGSYSAPVFVGGGISHGPDGTQNYRLELPSAQKKNALNGALSLKANEKKVIVLKNADKFSGKTAEAVATLKAIKLENKKVLVVVGDKQQMLTRAFRNIANVQVLSKSTINPYVVLNNEYLLLCY